MTYMSEQIDQIATALTKAQGQLKNPKKDKTAKVKTKSGADFQYSYSDLASVRDAIIPTLAECGIAVVQFTEVVQAGLLLHTKLVHTSGQWIESTYPINNNPENPQGMGSAISYGRRYCLSAMVCVASEDDDDGERAASHPKNGHAQPQASEQRFVYQRLVNTMRSTGDDAGVDEWKERNKHDINSLDETYYAMLGQAVNDHRLSFKGAAVPAPKKEKLSSRALPPMPNDDLGAAS